MAFEQIEAAKLVASAKPLTVDLSTTEGHSQLMSRWAKDPAAGTIIADAGAAVGNAAAAAAAKGIAGVPGKAVSEGPAATTPAGRDGLPPGGTTIEHGGRPKGGGELQHVQPGVSSGLIRKGAETTTLKPRTGEHKPHAPSAQDPQAEGDNPVHR